MNTPKMIPHNWWDGIKRIPLHLAAFGGPALIADLLLPPGPWKFIPAGIMISQAIRGEYDDVKNGEDTIPKAIIDGVSQSALAVLGIFL